MKKVKLFLCMKHKIFHISLHNNLKIYLGFFLDYDHILTAHPPLRDRMLYGLNKIAHAIIRGVPKISSYFYTCENFEMLMEKLYASK